MKILKTALLAMFIFTATEPTFADIKYVSDYYRKDGTYVSGHYKDTSGDGQSWNNRGSILGY